VNLAKREITSWRQALPYDVLKKVMARARMPTTAHLARGPAEGKAVVAGQFKRSSGFFGNRHGYCAYYVSSSCWEAIETSQRFRKILACC